MPDERNDHLHAALTQAGIEVEQLAQAVDVDIKTVERWLAGRVPYSRHRRRVARALNSTEHAIWPDTVPAPRPAPDPDAEAEETASRLEDVIASYASTEDPDAPDLVALIATAEHQIDLYHETLDGLINRPSLADTLRDRANAGCQIRILLTDPGPAPTATPDTPYWRDPRILAHLTAQRSRGYLDPLLDQPGLLARLVPAGIPHAFIRADERMVVILNLGTLATPAAVLHLRQQSTGGLFARIDDHLDELWANAGPVLTPDPRRYPHPDQDPDRYLPLRP